MNNKKIFAAIVTTLVLFAIIRSCSPDSNQFEKPVEQEEIWEPADQLSGLEKVEEAAKKVEVAVVEPTIEKDKKTYEMAKKAFLKAEKAKAQQFSEFTQKSENVFFKVKDGLALVGGDVIIGELSAEQKKKDLKGRLLKQKPQASKLWPSNQIPIAFSVGFPEGLKAEVQKAVKYMNAETVLEFVNAEEGVDQDLIIFQERSGAPCSSYLGRVGGYQPIYLNNQCKAQDVLHELMHALGFVHEQQREERDDSIEILWENIDELFAYNFAILPDSMVHPYEGSVFRLDFKSVMMYPDSAFAESGKKSMLSLSNQKISPINSGLSDIDKKRLEYLYGS